MDNLPIGEQILLKRLHVFAGIFSLEAAEAICIDDNIKQNFLHQLLKQLVKKSLLVTEEQAQIIWCSLAKEANQATGNDLADDDEADIFRWRHAAYYVGLAEQARQEMFGAKRRAWLDRLKQEHANLQAALGWLVENEEAEQGIRLAIGLREFWDYHHSQQGEKWLDKFLSLPAMAAPTELRAQALDDIAALDHSQGKDAAAIFEESLAIRRALGDKGRIALSLIHLGHAKWYFENDHVSAHALYEESLVLYQELGDKVGVSHVQLALGQLSCFEEEYATAYTLLWESLSTLKDTENLWTSNFALMAFAHLAAYQGQPEHALRLGGATEALRESIGFYQSPFWQAWDDKRLKPAHQAVHSEQKSTLWAEGRKMSFPQAIDYALEYVCLFRL